MRIQDWFSRFHNYLDLLKIDKKLLVVCILSLLVPITLNGIYFLFSHIQLIRNSEFRQARNNIDRIENRLYEIMDTAVDIANRVYVSSRIQQAVAAEYRTPLEVYTAYNEISLFDDYLRSHKEIAGIRLYVENQTMLNNSYFMVATDTVRREPWYTTAMALDGKIFWVYRYDDIFRSNSISLVRRIRNTTTGRHVGILCIALDMGNLERICAAELHDTFISINGEVVCPPRQNGDSDGGGEGGITNISSDGNWIITNEFSPRQTQGTVFAVTYSIPYTTLLAPVHAISRRSMIMMLAALIVSLVLILQIVNEVYVQKLQKEQLFSHQKEMQLKLLSNQINPHFLYNTLETIRMMALGKKEPEIAVTIKMLSQILRQSLSTAEKTVPLEKELELVQNYLAIQKLRFGDRLRYSMETDSGADRCGILPLLIQPLVENSVIHGMETKTGDTHIRITVTVITTAAITATVHEKLLRINVSDNGLGMEPEQLEKIRAALASGADTAGGRIGLVNVDRRIKLYYGSAFGLAIARGSTSGGDNNTVGVTVCMTLPVIEEV